MAENNAAPGAWTVVRSHYLHRQPWLTVRQDHVRLPSGAEIEDYFVLEYPTWVNVLAVTTSDQFVVIKQYRHALGKVHFELPAGACDPSDASLLDSAKRELLEETGYGGGDWSLFMTLSPNAGTHTNLSYTFLATDVVRLNDPTPEPTEDIVVDLLSRDALFERSLDGSVVQALHAAPILKYFCRRT